MKLPLKAPKQLGSGLKFIKSGNYIVTRIPWGGGYDFGEVFNLVDTSFNGCVESVTQGIDTTGQTDANFAARAIANQNTILKWSSDDICPMSYNASYIGANHGGLFAYNITAAGHDKTVQDVGSEWTQSDSTKTYLLKIVDANTLLVMTLNTSGTEVWSFHSVNGTTLTHSAGATHTGTITFSSPVQVEIYPSLKNHTYQVLADSYRPIAADGTYTCDHLDIVESYDVIDFNSMLNYVRSQTGSSVQPAFNAPAVDVSVNFRVIYRIQDNGAVTVYQKITTYHQIALGYVGMVQAMTATKPSGGTVYQYVPKTASFTIGSNSYNLATIQDITNLVDTIELTAEKWSDVNNPPDRYLQYAKTSGGAIYNNYGFTLGYCTAYAAAGQSIRKTAAASAMQLLSSSKKMYPKLATGGSATYPDSLISAGKTFEAVSFRCPVNYNNDTGATVIAWYQVGDVTYLMLDYHTSVSKTLTIPVKFAGKTIGVVEKSANFSLNSQIVTAAGGINIAVTGVYGYAVLSLV
ncbi:MAG: hypothetical protein P4N59_25600 [Negativicutes bacterium]|nr:hypothetical protein [Negativicutes bacterium]